MAPPPQYRQLLEEFSSSLKDYTSKVAQEEGIERRNILNGACSISLNARLRSIEKDQEALHAAIASLRAQQAVFERLRDYAHNAKLPICKIPVEILSNILETSIPRYHDLWALDPAQALYPQWKSDEYVDTLRSFGTTCCRIRTAIIASPRCWTLVPCVVARRGTLPEVLAKYLARSRNCRFHLRLKLETDGVLPSTYVLQAFSHVLLPHMHRCESLGVTSDNRRADIPGLIPPAIPLKNLRHVMFNWKGPAEAGEPNIDGKAEAIILSILNGIETPPLSLEIDGLSRPGHQLMVNFNLMQVQSLTRLWIGENCSALNMLQLLRRCTHLEHLYWKSTACDDEDEDEEGSETPPFTLNLNHLTSLQMECDGYEDAHQMFLSAPRLEQLDALNATELLAFDILHPDHPPFPSLTPAALPVPNRHSERVVPFLQSHPRIVECYLHTRLLPDGLPDVCAAVESFLAPTQARSVNVNDPSHKSCLQYLSLEMPWRDFQQVEDELTVTLELVLHMLDGLHIDLNLHVPDDASMAPKVSEGHFKNRVIVDPPRWRVDIWRSAWGAPS